MIGQVYKVHTDSYSVKLDGKLNKCGARGILKRKGEGISVGDFVEVDELGNDVAYITKIEERENYIIRRASNLSKESHILASNLSQTLLIVTIAHP